MSIQLRSSARSRTQGAACPPRRALAPWTGVALLALASVASASSLTPGNVVVLRVGTGAAALSNAATAVFLDEYTTSGAFVQTLALPTIASGANLPLTNSGTATSEGLLTLSADGRYLVHAGYGAIPGTAAVVSTASASTPRVVARVALDGTIDTSTALVDAYSANNIRSATSDDGSRFWTAGTAAAGGGVRFATLGGTTTAQLSTTITNTRVVGIAAGQLYVSSATGAFQGVSAVGSGLPTTSGQTITLLPGFPTSAGPGAYDFYFADASTLYVADDRAVASGGGLQKWTFNGTTWTLAYTLNVGLTAGLRGVSAVPGSSPLQFFATSADTLPKLVSVVDSGAPSAFSVVLTSATNTALRGVRYVPVTCTQPAIGAGPSGVSVCPGGSASFSVTATGTAPLAYSWRLNGFPLSNGGAVSGQGTPNLSISPVAGVDAGAYDCVVTNSCGNATSSAATLDVLVADGDGDGTPDCSDGCPADPLKTAPGVCGCGVADVDGDGDGTLDCNDGCPSDPLKTAPGACGCGVADVDSDGDGTLDCNDGCPSDPSKVAPGACGCGTPDTDGDGDGTADCNDGCPSDPLKTAPGACGCGALDTDSDGDGTADCNDGCPNDPLKTLPGACGCGVLDTDGDGDGTLDCNDGCPADPLKTAPGACGCGVVDADANANGVADCNEFTLAEVLINPPGSDDGFEFVEIRGPASTQLSNLWLLVVEGDGGSAGAIDVRYDLGALATGSNGLLLLRDAATTLVPAPDPATSVAVQDFAPDLENGSNTFVLGRGTPPALAFDLDVDGDGAIDAGSLAGFTVLDAVTLLENDANNFAYADDLGGTVLGPTLGYNADLLYRVHGADGAPCNWNVAELLATSPVGGPYQLDPAQNVGFADHGLDLVSPPLFLSPGVANVLPDANANGIPNACEVVDGVPFCFGDSGCPCGNDSVLGAGEGCVNSTGVGTKLAGAGSTSVIGDALVLTATQLQPHPVAPSFVVFFQGDAASNAPFADGKRCASGNVVRLATKAHQLPTASYPEAGDQPVSVRGLVPPSGARRYYQVWYRNALGPCGTFSNLSNGVAVNWVP